MYTQLEQRGMPEPPVNVSTLLQMKQHGEPIAWLTAYDASFAALVDAAGTDLVLVGDSLGMVIQGHDTTVPVTVDDIVYHSRTVARGLRRAFLVADMPFMSYTNPGMALDNSVRLMQEGGAMMVKLEGGDDQVEIVEHLARHDIPVCAHLGLSRSPFIRSVVSRCRVESPTRRRKCAHRQSDCRMPERTLFCWSVFPMK